MIPAEREKEEAMHILRGSLPFPLLLPARKSPLPPFPLPPFCHPLPNSFISPKWDCDHLTNLRIPRESQKRSCGPVVIGERGCPGCFCWQRAPTSSHTSRNSGPQATQLTEGLWQVYFSFRPHCQHLSGGGYWTSLHKQSLIVASPDRSW